MNRVGRWVLVWLAVVVALVVLLTALRTDPGRTPGVMTDTLGPDTGEDAAAYLRRAGGTLAAGGESDGYGDAPRWALVSPAQPWRPAEAAAAVHGVPRVGELLAWDPYRAAELPPERVALAEPVAGATRESVIDAGLGRSRAGAPVFVVGLVVRADTAVLRDVAARPGVRAVEALPPDAVAGRFPVRASLP